MFIDDVDNRGKSRVRRNVLYSPLKRQP
jgi:hypothetical protein